MPTMPPSTRSDDRRTPKRNSISAVAILSACFEAWTTTGPRQRVGHVRFSMSLMPVTMSAAYGCRMLITFIASSD
jgi:hypothetical protein